MSLQSQSRPHVMIDLETLGTDPGATILSIGAVAVHPETGEQSGTPFYVAISRDSCRAHGLTEDPKTIAWWEGQSDAARIVLDDPLAMTLDEALQLFCGWWERRGARIIWCHGATFDGPILAAALRALDMPIPWQFWNARDTRTIYDAAGVKPDRKEGVHHNALIDALRQAEALHEAYRRLGLSASRRDRWTAAFRLVFAGASR